MRCWYCGFHGTLDDFEEDMAHHLGFWCPDCDTFTMFDKKENGKRMYRLYLEDVSSGNSLEAYQKIKQNVSPLRYPGGKTKLIPYIASILPDTVTRIVEPFCGGSSVSLALLLAGKVDEIVLNDMDINVISLFRTIMDNPHQLIQRIWNTTLSREQYFSFQKSLLAEEEIQEEERAFRFLYCNRTAFSGIIFANPMSNLNARWNPKVLQKRILDIWKASDKIMLCMEDAKQLIEEEYWHGEDTFIFIDPPYFKKGGALYRKAYQESDHADLSFVLEHLYRQVPGAHMVITYDNEKVIRDLYKIPRIQVFKPTYSIANGNQTQKFHKENLF